MPRPRFPCRPERCRCPHRPRSARCRLAPGQGLVIDQASDGVTANTGNLFLVTDQGIKFPVVSLSALQALGLGKTIAPAPAELVGLLPLGPTLDRAPARRFFGEAPHANG